MTPARRRRLVVALSFAAIYPACVLTFVWYHVITSDLPGGQEGPLDAYRHSLASALVSFTIGPWAVNVVSGAMEFGDTPSHAMDRHNNAIGARIGTSATSLGDIERLIAAKVKNGAENATDPEQITWMPPTSWQDSTFF